jgi:uncharacterized protein YkwD
MLIHAAPAATIPDVLAFDLTSARIDAQEQDSWESGSSDDMLFDSNTVYEHLDTGAGAAVAPAPVMPGILGDEPPQDSYTARPQELRARLQASAKPARLSSDPVGRVPAADRRAGAAGSLLTPEESVLFALVNARRARTGVRPLEIDPALVELARKKSKDLAVHNVFSHESPTYGSPRAMLQAANVKFVFMGENLASGATPAKILSMWALSPAHMDNILNPSFTHVGVGIYCDGQHSPMTTAIFVRRN